MFLGIDIGTSSVKAVLVDERESITAQATMPLIVARPRPMFAEQDPQDWWFATVAAINTLPPAARAEVRAVGLTGQMHGATLLDESGKTLRAAIL
ncbi:MAG: FGGY family carbohydrate kinase, partial [Steroidobacteraceae bacterium]